MLRDYLILVMIINGLPYLTSAHQVTCMKTAARNMINRSEQIQSIAKYILNQLNYSQPPDAPSSTIPQDKLTDYHMQKHREANAHECDRKGSNAISIRTIPGNPMHLQSASESGSGSDSKRASGDHSIGGDIILASYDIEFSNETINLNKHPHLVELMVYKEKSNCNNDHKQDDVFQLVEVIEKSNTTSIGKVIAVRLIDLCSTKGYISFNVTKAALRWIEQRLTKISLTLTIKCISSLQCDLRPENQVRFSTSSKNLKLPHLVIENYVKPKDANSQPTQQKRRRRNTSSRYNFCSNSSQNCCLKELTVNFQKDLGWNFVKLPKEIYVNYCDGLCPLGTNSTPTHFELLAGIHSSNYPCCSGITYEPVTMLVDNGNGTADVLELPKMTVTSCQCG